MRIATKAIQNGTIMKINLLDKCEIYKAIIMNTNVPHGFINKGRNEIRKAPDDKIGASLSFSINDFAYGRYGSFEKRNQKFDIYLKLCYN